MYVSSPRSLTEMNITMNTTVEVAKVNSLLFDSLSTLLIYEKPRVVIKFAHAVMSKLRGLNGTKHAVNIFPFEINEKGIILHPDMPVYEL